MAVKISKKEELVIPAITHDERKSPPWRGGLGGRGKGEAESGEFCEEAAFVQIDVVRELVGSGEGGPFDNGVGTAWL